MPYKSEAQRKFMYSQKPEVAKRFEAEGNNRVAPKTTASGIGVKDANAGGISTGRSEAISRRMDRMHSKPPVAKPKKGSDSDYA